MYQNYPNYYQTQQPTPQAPIPRMNMGMALKGRPVSSLDEVRATSVDFDGSISYFPDLANKRIYTKQINMDGTALLNMYELKNMPIEANDSNYVTREEFEMTIKNLIAQLTPAPTAQQPAKPENLALQF